MKQSIVHDYYDVSENVCFYCGKNRNAGLEKHHIFGAANRKLSDRDGLWVMLCKECHTEGPMAAHKCKETQDDLHRMGRQAYLDTHTEQEFLERYGRMYNG